MPAKRKVRAVTIAVLASSAMVLASCSSDPSSADRFSVLPDACKLVSPKTAQEVVGVSDGSQESKSKTSDSCSWTYKNEDPSSSSAENTVPWRRSLTVSVYLHESPGGDSTGSEIAKRSMKMRREGAGKTTTISKLGDEAYGTYSERDGSIRFRNSNVTVSLRYSGVDSSDNNAVGVGKERISTNLLKVARETNKYLQEQ